MTGFDEILEARSSKVLPTPMLVKILAIISYVVYGLIAIAFIFSLWYNYFRVNNNSSSSVGDLGSLYGLRLIAILVLSLLVIIGAVKMHQGKKSGFGPYLIGNGVFALIQFFTNDQAAGIILGTTSVVLIISFATQLKYLN